MQKVITLATLAQATSQEVFNQVAKHMLTQMQKSRSDTGGPCLYRYGELKCAAGCLMSDEEYGPDMESFSDSGYGGSWRNLIAANVVPDAHSGLVIRLQEVHDGSPPSLWAEDLSGVAGEFGLEFKGV